MKNLPRHTLFILLLLAGVVFSLLSFSDQKNPVAYHDEIEFLAFRAMADSLPQGSNSLFTGSGRCSGCHGYDPLENANITSDGEDINMTDQWRATMMANSAKDPFWRAKVSHEVAINPEHQIALEDKCTSCHAPLGRFAAIHDGAESYAMSDLHTDTIGLDGVSCNACHQLSPNGIGQSFSGELTFVEDTLYGQLGNDPEADPIFTPPMQSFVEFLPIYGAHVDQSELCSGCHTLITNTVDLEGEFTGTDFVEQATYHEWVNSAYNNDPEEEQQCQGCHLPRVDEPIVISSNYAFLPGRSPYGQHFLVGANSFMLELMRDNIDTLGITADESHFDAVIERTIDQLQHASALIEITDLGLDADSGRYSLKVTNLAGHKFPSGYPARRMFIEFVAADENGDTLFKSGVIQPNFEVEGQNADYEPHYDLITTEDQVQIYEMVMGDVNGNVTTVLERADEPIKDNRLVPKGFSMTHFAYDTTKMAGLVLNDFNFNIDSLGNEGTGTDIIEYHFPLYGYEGPVHVTAELFYQSAPPKWNEEMFAVSTPEIEFFKTMYNETGADPVRVQSDSIMSIMPNVAEAEQEVFTVFPNPSRDGKFVVLGHANLEDVQVFDARGTRIQSSIVNMRDHAALTIPYSAGTYFISIQFNGRREVHQVVVF